MTAYRHELKYLINFPDWSLLCERLPAVVSRDPHAGATGEYHIRSLYFDDYWNTAYEEKNAGVLIRRKYRIRVYNCSDRWIILERKNKYGPYIQKDNAPLTREELQRILDGDYGFLLHSSHNLLREFYYECTSRIMRPRVIVDYDREPYVMDAGTVRITFDKHVRAGFGEYSLFDPELPTMEVIPGDKMIMEVKFTEFLPSQVKQMIPPRAREMTAVSKFVLCCDAAVREHEIDRTEGLLWKVQQ